MFRKLIKQTPRLHKSANEFIGEYHLSKQSGDESKFLSENISLLQQDLKEVSIEDKAEIIRLVILINTTISQTIWADFSVLDVMSYDQKKDNYSIKRLAYTAASLLWNQSSDVVLMATQRLQKDLKSTNPYMTSCVLSALPSFLTPSLSQVLATDILSFMKSSNISLRLKATTCFYHLCINYPEALKLGYPSLKAILDDSNPSIISAGLTTLSELVFISPNTFLPLIPKLHKMISQRDLALDSWGLVKLIKLLTSLAKIENRLPKKLIDPFLMILEETQSVTVLYEVVLSVAELNLNDEVLLSLSTARIQNLLEHQNSTLRFLSLELFMKLIKIQPKLISQHREFISNCIDSPDESIVFLALDLLAQLATRKSLISIIDKLFHQFRVSLSYEFRDKIFVRVIEICSKDDYNLIRNFSWYIDVLMKFFDDGGFRSYNLLADQFLDLVIRVPSTREKMVNEMQIVFRHPAYRKIDVILLTAIHIISDYATSSQPISALLHPALIEMSSRVQTAALIAAIRLYLLQDTPNSDYFIELPNEFLSDQNYEKLFLEHSNSDIIETSKKSEKNTEKNSEENSDKNSESKIDNDKNSDQKNKILLSDIFKTKFEMLDTTETSINLREFADMTLIFSELCNENIEIFNEFKKELSGELPVLDPIKIPPEVNKPVTLFDEPDGNDNSNSNKAKIVSSKTRKTKISKKPIHKTHITQINKDDGRYGSVDLETLDKSIFDEIKQEQQEGKKNIKARLISMDNNQKLSDNQKRNSKPGTKIKKIKGICPEKGGRSQILVKGDFEIVADEFKPDGNELLILLRVTNSSKALISSVGIELLNNGKGVNSVDIENIPELGPGEEALHLIKISIDKILLPHIAKLRFIPISDFTDVSDCDLRIYPSFFLQSLTEIPEYFNKKQLENQEKKVFESILEVSGIDNDELLQIIANIVRGHTGRKKIICGKMTTGESVVVSLTKEDSLTLVNICSDNESLLDSVQKEINAKLESQ